MATGPGTRGTTLGAVLFAVLALMTVGAFAVTRAARSGDDLVNSVELSPEVRGGPARVAFTLAKPDDDVAVFIIEGDPGSDRAVVRSLALGEDLDAGEHVYEWDGRADDGKPAPGGQYALRVVLGEAGRDILPPGRIELGPLHGTSGQLLEGVDESGYTGEFPGEGSYDTNQALIPIGEGTD